MSASSGGSGPRQHYAWDARKREFVPSVPKKDAFCLEDDYHDTTIMSLEVPLFVQILLSTSCT
jgi:hypothetical protein